jgi:S-formylglutathione hydrolase FrmB
MNRILIVAFLIGLVPFIAAGQVDTLEVYSAAMDKKLKVAVTLPDGYDSNRDILYPTVYVLHGGSGQFSDWHQKITAPGLLSQLANQYGFILVTPGVGPSSYYYDSPKMDSVKYETYITKELIPEIDKKYRTIARREARAITGLSMGGHGAITLSAKHPDLFIAAGSMSGVMNIDTRKWKVGEDFAALRRKQQYAMLGEINYETPFSEYTAV